MNRLPSRIAPALIALAALLSAPAAPGAPLSADCGPPPAGAMCLDGPWFDFATMKIDLAQGEVRSRYEITVGAGRESVGRGGAVGCCWWVNDRQRASAKPMAKSSAPAAPRRRANPQPPITSLLPITTTPSGDTV